LLTCAAFVVLKRSSHIWWLVFPCFLCGGDALAMAFCSWWFGVGVFAYRGGFNENCFFHFCNLFLLNNIPVVISWDIFVGAQDLPVGLFGLFAFAVPSFLGLWLTAGRIGRGRGKVAHLSFLL
jgi:hypothetical protein